jgi:hypothetical protein
MSLSQPVPASLPSALSQGSPEGETGRLAGWRRRLERALIALAGMVTGLESVLMWVKPGAENDEGGFSARRTWEHLLRAGSWIKAMRARLAEEGRAERAARRAEDERLGKPLPARARRKPGAGGKKPPAKAKPDDCIAGRTDHEVMAQICADLAVVAWMLEDDDAARLLAIYQREVEALLGGPKLALVAEAEAERRMAARTAAAAASREMRQRDSTAPGAGHVMTAGLAAVAVHAPDSG